MALSSLVIVPTCGEPAVVMLPFNAPETAPRVTLNVSFASTLVSPLTVTVMVCVSLSVPAKLSVPSLSQFTPPVMHKCQFLNIERSPRGVVQGVDDLLGG